MSERIALFPLSSVLFPGLMLPLHIFEERYRLLIRHLIELPDGARREFGVVAIRAGHEVGPDAARDLYDIGCTAVLRGITPYDDGRFDIVTSGSRRFELLRVHHQLPYLQADVRWIPEAPAGEQAPDPDAEASSYPAEPGLAELRDSVARAFRRYQGVVAGTAADVDLKGQPLPQQPQVLSYLVSAAMLLDLSDKQRLLATPDVPARLKLLRQLLGRELTLVGHLRAVPALDLLRLPQSSN